MNWIQQTLYVVSNCQTALEHGLFKTSVANYTTWAVQEKSLNRFDNLSERVKRKS